MFQRAHRRWLQIALLLILLLSPLKLLAKDLTEETGVAIAVTAGNLWFVPIKALSVMWGLTEGAISFVFSGGDMEMTRQIWEDTTRAPYFISPDIARAGMGLKPELKED